ncbi:MAG TPA: DUF167 domain-containing protein [Tepidisphaeraceae bacterium]|jgi:uncharacterized protein YggU (UPF0235/DUF167 family)
MIDTDFIWRHFSLMEWLLTIEIIVLLTAAFFYQVAKQIARTDRHDPLVRFYRVFWRAFFTSVTPLRQLELQEAEVMARSAGLAGVDGANMGDMDAPDLFGDDDMSEGNPPPQQLARPLGRTGPEDDKLLRKAAETESREAQFIRHAKETKSAAPAAPQTAREKIEAGDAHRAATSTFDALLVPFSDSDELVGYKAGEVVVNVVCAPEDGSANGVIINLVAERIGVRPYQIVLLRGHYKVRKTLQIAGLDQPTLEAKLRQM